MACSRALASHRRRFVALPKNTGKAAHTVSQPAAKGCNRKPLPTNSRIPVHHLLLLGCCVAMCVLCNQVAPKPQNASSMPTHMRATLFRALFVVGMDLPTRLSAMHASATVPALLCAAPPRSGSPPPHRAVTTKTQGSPSTQHVLATTSLQSAELFTLCLCVSRPDRSPTCCRKSVAPLPSQVGTSLSSSATFPAAMAQFCLSLSQAH